MPLDKVIFFKRYKISEEDFANSELNWSVLESIYEDYLLKIPELLDIAQNISNTLQKNKRVHSVRFRVKDSEHVIEKIIRKTLKDPSRNYDQSNYISMISDLVGVRAIHLFKSSWIPIDEYIQEKWELNEPQIAYIRDGDAKVRSEVFEKKGLKVENHPNGYRSLHYIIKTKPNKTEYLAEIQSRTIFEEGWSEIDHKIRYPYETENELLNEFLMIFNRLAGSADEMGSYIQTLNLELKEKDREYQFELDKKQNEIEVLKLKLEKLELNPVQRADINKSISKISSFSKTAKLSDMFNSNSQIGSFLDLNNKVNDFLEDLDTIENPLFRQVRVAKKKKA